MSKAMENTDRELWREVEGDFYSASIHVTKYGGIGIEVNGAVFVLPVQQWHGLARKHLLPLLRFEQQFDQIPGVVICDTKEPR